MSDNDKRIIELKKIIEQKKQDLGEPVKVAPRTSCILEFAGSTYNLHVQNKDTLHLLYCWLASLKNAGEKYLVDTSFLVSGFPIDDWMADIWAEISLIYYREEKAKLASMETKLDNLLSSDKRTELEIDAIAAML